VDDGVAAVGVAAAGVAVAGVAVAGCGAAVDGLEVVAMVDGDSAADGRGAAAASSCEASGIRNLTPQCGQIPFFPAR
jgi:hypothetical protein